MILVTIADSCSCLSPMRLYHPAVTEESATE